MRSVNRVFLMGHLGQQPELQKSRAGRPYTRLNVATNRHWVNDDGKQEKSDWHSVFVWGEQAERCVEFLRKGAKVFIEGSLTYWRLNEDLPQKTYKNAIQADRVHFISYGRPTEVASALENLDNPESARNHDAVAHPLM
jgi:single-strand DNA-binding protein